MAASQRVLAWGDQAVPRAPRQERANGAPHPNHPANQGTAQVRRSGIGLLCASQGRVAREVRERREEEELEEAREDNEGEEFIFKWVTTF